MRHPSSHNVHICEDYDLRDGIGRSPATEMKRSGIEVRAWRKDCCIAYYTLLRKTTIETGEKQTWEFMKNYRHVGLSLR